MMKFKLFAAALIMTAGLLTGCKSAQDMAQAKDPTLDYSQFVNITDVVPDAILEVRYFSTYNFVGARIDGYEEPVALLTRQAADSLKAASDDLMLQGYCIKIYDAYRPQRAVDHFMRWALVEDDTVTKAYFYPRLTKKEVFDGEYVATKSGHSRGSTIDLTIIDMKTGKELDMGGTFDWFGIESHPDFGGGNPANSSTTAWSCVQRCCAMVSSPSTTSGGTSPSRTSLSLTPTSISPSAPSPCVPDYRVRYDLF